MEGDAAIYVLGNIPPGGQGFRGHGGFPVPWVEAGFTKDAKPMAEVIHLLS